MKPKKRMHPGSDASSFYHQSEICKSRFQLINLNSQFFSAFCGCAKVASASKMNDFLNTIARMSTRTQTAALNMKEKLGSAPAWKRVFIPPTIKGTQEIPI